MTDDASSTRALGLAAKDGVANRQRANTGANRRNVFAVGRDCIVGFSLLDRNNREHLARHCSTKSCDG